MDYYRKQALEMAALLVRATLIPKERESATAAVLTESLMERFKGYALLDLDEDKQSEAA